MNREAIAGQEETDSRWGMLGVLSFCHFVNDYYAMVIPPVLPFLARDFGLTYFQSGLLGFMSHIVSAFLQPIVGYIADIQMWRKAAIIALIPKVVLAHRIMIGRKKNII